MNINITKLVGLASGLALGLTMAAGTAMGQSTTASTSSDSPKEMTKADPTKSPKAKADPNKSSKAKSAETIPTSQSVGDDAGDFTVTSTIEFGYRGQRVDGDVNKFKSDLNYKAGPRLFDSTFLMKSKDGGKGDLFDTLLVTSTGWGADPSGNLRLSAEKPDLYRFEGTYRRFKYYRYLNSIVNPNWVFSPATFSVPPNQLTGLHGYDTYTQMGDFDLTILPKNETIRFNVGYSPERYTGPFFTNYHMGGNEFWLQSNARSRSDDWRFGADGKLGPIDWTFLQGFRRFRDDSEQPDGVGINRNPAAAQLTSFDRVEPTRGHVNYTRASLHSLIANKLDITGRIIYSKAKSNSTFLESLTAVNWNTRITGYPPTPPAATPNILNLGTYNITADVERPNTVGDIGITYLATDKFRVSNTFRVEDFTIDGVGSFSDFFSTTRGTRTDTIGFSNQPVLHTIKYRKYTNTFEGDYQFNPRYAIHFGYRYGKRNEQQTISGTNFGSNSAPAITPEFEEETNHTHAFFGGFKARPAKNLTFYFDAEHGTADNVFTRIGNYDYTNIRAKTRWTPNRHWNLNLAFISRDNSNPSEIAGVSLSDFGVSVKSRVFTSSVDWMPDYRFTVSGGYNYNWVNSNAVIDYFYNSVRHPSGLALYYQRLNYFFIDVTSRINRRMTLYTSYRVNDDNGQGDRIADPTGLPGTLVTSYPMSFNSPDARLAIRLNRHLDWNLGYSYYSYNESDFLRTFPGSPRAQNYHAHLPYMSLRVYIGRKE